MACTPSVTSERIPSGGEQSVGGANEGCSSCGRGTHHRRRPLDLELLAASCDQAGQEDLKGHRYPRREHRGQQHKHLILDRSLTAQTDVPLLSTLHFLLVFFTNLPLVRFFLLFFLFRSLLILLYPFISCLYKMKVTTSTVAILSIAHSASAFAIPFLRPRQQVQAQGLIPIPAQFQSTADFFVGSQLSVAQLSALAAIKINPLLVPGYGVTKGIPCGRQR